MDEKSISDIVKEMDDTEKLVRANFRLCEENEYLKQELSLVRVELTKINNVIQPLWGKIRKLRIEHNRNPQTGNVFEDE